MFILAFPVYAYLEGWLIAGLHTLLVVTWALLLTNIVLIRFRKIPFTCTLPLFKQHSFVTLLSGCFGFLIYAVSTPEFESSALAEPLRMLSLAPFALVLWYIPHYLGKNSTELERRLIFEESPDADDRSPAARRLAGRVTNTLNHEGHEVSRSFFYQPISFVSLSSLRSKGFFPHSVVPRRSALFLDTSALRQLS